MKKRILAWILLAGFVFIIVNVTLFFLNIRLSETHLFIMKISAIVYFGILLVMLIFKVRDDMRSRNQINLDNYNENASGSKADDTAKKKNGNDKNGNVKKQENKSDKSN